MRQKIVTTLILVIGLTFFVNEVKGWDSPLEIDVVSIEFDFETGYTDDALNIRKNASTNIVTPEWYPASSRNERFAYIKGQSNRKIKAQFTHNQSSGEIETIRVVGVKISGSGFGDAGSTDVTFPGVGVLSEITTCTVNGNVPSSIGKRSYSWQWLVTRVNGQSLYNWYTISSHVYYTVLGAPQSPMTEPWTEVLDYACVWAANQTTEAGVVTEITENAYTDFGKNYQASFGTHAKNDTLHLTQLLADPWADCRDMSAVVQVFTRAIGGTQTKVRLINDIDPQIENFKHKSIDPVGNPSWTTGTWSFHQVAYYSNSVYDACLKLSNPVRIPVGENINGDYKEDLFDPSPWWSVWVPDDGWFSYVFVD